MLTELICRFPVVAVFMAPVEPLELISAPAIRSILPAVNVLMPLMVAEAAWPFTSIEPAEVELVETLEFSKTFKPPKRSILPPGVVVPNVMAPSTVNVVAASINSVGVVVDEIIPLLVVDELVIVKLAPPKVIVLPLLLKVPLLVR